MSFLRNINWSLYISVKVKIETLAGPVIFFLQEMGRIQVQPGFSQVFTVSWPISPNVYPYKIFILLPLTSN